MQVNNMAAERRARAAQTESRMAVMTAANSLPLLRAAVRASSRRILGVSWCSRPEHDKTLENIVVQIVNKLNFVFLIIFSFVFCY